MQQRRVRQPGAQWGVASASPSGLEIVNDWIYMAAVRGARLWVMKITGNTTDTPRAFFNGRWGRLRTVVKTPDGGLWLTSTNNDKNGGTPLGARQQHRAAQVLRWDDTPDRVLADEHRVRQQRQHPDQVHLPAGRGVRQRHLAAAGLGCPGDTGPELRADVHRHRQRRQALGDLGHPGGLEQPARRTRARLQRAAGARRQAEGHEQRQQVVAVLRALPAAGPATSTSSPCTRSTSRPCPA